EEISYTIFTLENHIVYQKEVFGGDEITVRIRIHDYDDKRLHVFMTLHDPSGAQSAAYEVMSMGMDRKTNRPARLPELFARSSKDYCRTQNNDVNIKEMGRRIGIRR